MTALQHAGNLRRLAHDLRRAGVPAEDAAALHAAADELQRQYEALIHHEARDRLIAAMLAGVQSDLAAARVRAGVANG